MSESPNLLLITTDQQRFDTIQAAGAGHMLTPHLKWLCDQGVRFSRCYSDSPICVPARATLMTGRHGHRNGLTTNTNSPVPMAEHPTLPGLLARRGYQSRAVGKMHFHPMRAHYGFDHMVLPMDYYRAAAEQPHRGRARRHGLGENEMEPGFSGVDASQSVTQWLVDETIDFFETRDPTRPTFCWLSFPKPHPPFDCDRGFWELYDGIDLPEPVYGDWSASQDSVPGGLLEHTRILNHVERFSPQQLRNVRRAYYACITQIDYTLGRLFARLREIGRLEDTWIVFTADHGELLGDHWMGAKGVFLEGSAHVPLIVRPPSGMMDEVGIVRDDLVCLADVMPTLLGRTGQPVLEEAECDGVDLFAVGHTPRRHLVGSCGPLHAVYRDDHVYSFAEHGGAELMFDLANDPYEQRELLRAGASTEAATARELMTEFLSTHRPEAVRGGRPVATRDPLTRAETNRMRWPGFHSQSVPSDVLH